MHEIKSAEGKVVHPELKSAVEKFEKNWHDFKEQNDKNMAEVKAGRAEDREAIQRAEKALTESKAEFDQKLAEVEKKMNRQGLAGGTGAGEDAEFKALEEFKRSVREGKNLDIEAYRQYKSAFENYVRRNNAYGSADEIKALSVGSDADGGFIVPADMSGRIVQLIRETSPIRQVASVVTIGTDALEGLHDLDDAASGWVGEEEARTETSTPKFGEYRIPVHEQYAEPRATQKLLDDAMFDVESWLVRKITDRLARMENQAFVKGNGVKKPRGFLTYGAGTPSASNFSVIEQVVSGGAGAFAASNAGDALINLVYKLKSAYREGAVFMMNRSTLASVRKLKDGDGNYLWQPDFQSRQGGKLLGFNIVEAEDMPDIASDSLSIAFGDFNAGYQIVDRMGIRVLRDAFTSKPYVKFYTTKRTGGAVVNFDAIKLMKFAES